MNFNLWPGQFIDYEDRLITTAPTMMLGRRYNERGLRLSKAANPPVEGRKMTKIVYASPDISPEVWTPPRGVVVLPLSEHPAIVAESQIEKMPGEPRRTPRRTKETQAERITEYLKAHPPADARTIAQATGINWQRVKWVLLAHPDVFCRVGRVQVRKVYRTLWGLVEDSRNA